MSERIDRSSPEALLKSWLWAVNHVDGAVYNELFATNKLAEEFANDATVKVTKLVLTRIIQYGDFSICELAVSLAITETGVPQVNKNAAFLFPMKKRGGEYYATEELLSDKAYKFIKFYYDVSPIYGVPVELELNPNNCVLKGFFCETNYLMDNHDNGAPIVFRIRGEKYETNTIVDKWPTKADQDLSSPAGTLASAIAALNSGDIERYSTLLHPEDRTNLVHYGWNTIAGQTWESIMRDQFGLESSQKRPSAIRLDKQIVYSDGVVALVYENANSKAGGQQDVLYFRKQGDHWFISHKMEERGVQLMNYLGFGASMKTKLFPHFDPAQEIKK
jgi:hypothetical protein